MLSLLETGDLPGYRSVAGKLVSQYSKTSDPNSLNGAAWYCTYASDAVADLAVPVQMAEKALAGYPPELKRLAVNTLGAALCRAGRIDEAIARPDESVKASGGVGIPQDWAFLAMAHNKKGNGDEARRWLEKLRSYKPDEKAGFSTDVCRVPDVPPGGRGAAPGDSSRAPLIRLCVRLWGGSRRRTRAGLGASGRLLDTPNVSRHGSHPSADDADHVNLILRPACKRAKTAPVTPTGIDRVMLSSASPEDTTCVPDMRTMPSGWPSIDSYGGDDSHEGRLRSADYSGDEGAAEGRGGDQSSFSLHSAPIWTRGSPHSGQRRSASVNS